MKHIIDYIREDYSKFESYRYSRPYSEHSYERMRIVETSGGFAAREIIKIEWSSYDNHYQCYVHLENWPLTKRYFYFTINSKICSLLKDIALLTKGCTNDSIKDFLDKYPNTYRMIKINFLDDSEFWWGENYICTSSLCSKHSFIRKAKEYAKIIDNLLIELETLKLDTSKLIRKEPIRICSDAEIPKWLKVAVAVGGVVLIKCAVTAVANNADIDIEIPDFDGDADVSAIDIESGDICPSDYRDGYNVSFGANKTINGDVYLDTGRTITLEPSGGGLDDKVVDVYVKSGTNVEYIIDGNIPRKIDGVNQVKYNGIKYNV